MHRLEPVEYRCDEALLKGYWAGPRSGTAPLILLAPEALGIGPAIKGRAVRIAQDGYNVFVLDLYGAENLDIASARPLSLQLMGTPGLLRKRAFAGLVTGLGLPSVDRSRCAAIGYCQGGQTVLELARGGAPILASIGVHPGFQRASGSKNGPISAKILMLIGDDDPIVTQDEENAFKNEMRASGADWQLHVFGNVGHSFTNPDIDAAELDGFSYDENADQRSWKIVSSLLEEVFSF